MKHLFISLIAFLPLTLSWAQQTQKGNASISGKVVEKTTGEGLPFASVVLKNGEQKLIQGVITDENGIFNLVAVPVGNFTLEISYTGFEKYSQAIEFKNNRQKKRLETIFLKEDSTLMEGVEITGDIPQVSLRLDKKVFRVDKDVLSQSTTVSEVLENVPSVSVDPSGTVSLRGNTNVTILINGKRSGLTSAQAMEQIPSENVDRVEVITVPSARYEATGSSGIINIILKKNVKGGLTGHISARGGSPADYNTIGSLSYKTNKFNWFGTVGIRYTDYEGDYSRNQTSTKNGEPIFLEMVQDQHRHDDGRFYYFGSDYYINNKNSITMAFYRNETKDTDVTDFIYKYTTTHESLDSTLVTDGNSKEQRSYNQLEMNYTRTFNKEGRKLTFDLQYDFWNSTMKWDVLTRKTQPIQESIFNLKTTSIDKNNDIAIQSDYVTPLGENSKLELGGKLENRRVTGSFEAKELLNGTYKIMDGFDNSIRYDEQIIAAYAQFGNKKGKFNYLLGLRMEATITNVEGTGDNLKVRNEYTNLFPTLNLGYSLSEKTNMGLSYSHRINRPSLWQLNPFSEIEDFNTRFFGNPTLKPAYTDIIEFSLLQNGPFITFNPTFYYSYTTNTTIWNTLQNDAGVFESTIVNLDLEKRLGFEFSASVAPLKWLSFNGDFNAFRFWQKGMLNDRELDNDDSTWFSSLETSVKMGKSLSFQTRLNYRGATSTAITFQKPIWYLNAGLSKKMFDNKGNLSFRASNIFNTRKTKSETTGDNFFVSQIRSRNAARYSLSFSYRFDGKTAFESRTSRRRNRN
ncbi:TonB-dependent receptor domain-containing protein [Xanthovirga aplysinae]|uniref:TonB-dependent receptor domain-containing protein n=1 Tax=Xanthovirga aplysinae TaxID=2529853 RepID=UPI0012BB6385|nr:TonB-dependent receptor [Xanthovirga aplysinae]MTI32679.1 TonB-dependent receptor [Xanthovirga aplysinae]